jgi:hypothetical protein
MEKVVREFFKCLAILLFVSLPVFAYSVVLKDGRVIQFQKYRVVEATLLYIDDKGKEISLPLDSIDLVRTHQVNVGQNPPFDLPGPATAAPSEKCEEQSSLGELARKYRKVERGTTKRIYTTDDISSSSVTTGEEASPKGSDPDAWRQRLDSVRKKMAPFEDIDSAELARLALGNLNVDFPGRKEWEEQLFEQKQMILHLVQDAERAFQEYQETRDTMIQVKGLTKGEEDNYEQARKRLEQAIDRAQAQAYKLDSLINDGKKRAATWKGR